MSRAMSAFDRALPVASRSATPSGPKARNVSFDWATMLAMLRKRFVGSTVTENARQKRSSAQVVYTVAAGDMAEGHVRLHAAWKKGERLAGAQELRGPRCVEIAHLVGQRAR